MLIANLVVQHGLNEALHAPKERRMVAVVRVDVVQREQDRPKRTLAAFRNDNLRQVCEMRDDRGHCRELETARPEAALVAAEALHLEGYLREVAISLLPPIAEVGDANAKPFILRAAECRHRPRVQPIAVGDGERLGRREVQYPLPISNRGVVLRLHKRELPVVTRKVSQHTHELFLHSRLLPGRQVNHRHREVKVPRPATRALPATVRELNGGADDQQIVVQRLAPLDI